MEKHLIFQRIFNHFATINTIADFQKSSIKPKNGCFIIYLEIKFEEKSAIVDILLNYQFSVLDGHQNLLEKTFISNPLLSYYSYNLKLVY